MKHAMNSDIRVVSAQPEYRRVAARTPLKFGAVVVPECTYCTVKVTVENRAGSVADGYGGIFLMDFWCWPDPEVDHEAKVAAMQAVTDRYCELVCRQRRFAHPIDIFFELEEELRRMAEEVCRQRSLPAIPFLGALVCASPVDAAIHDAFGNVNGIDTYNGYGPQFCPDLSKWLGPDFKGKYIEQYIKPAYDRFVPIFHLVGGLDKLTRAEVDETDPRDGLPNSLDDWIASQGMHCLKVKLRGRDLDWDVERMLAVYRVAAEELGKLGRADELHLTADTNEQCDTPQYVIEMLARIREQSEDCFRRILYIEQPTERDMSAHRHDMHELSRIKPVLVDESLTDLQSFETAMELGWSGIALKTCKGHSADMVFASKARELGIPYAVQDLTNPSLALIHSVGMGARLYTIMGVEANSRQYFPFATSEAEKRVHSGIFDIRNGVADCSTLQGTGLGYRMAELQ